MPWQAWETGVPELLAQPAAVTKRIEGEDLFAPVHHDVVSPTQRNGAPEGVGSHFDCALLFEARLQGER